jgi:DNA-binding LytR/AlgR family response regulator
MKEWISMIVPLINSKGQISFLDVHKIIYIQTNRIGELIVHSYDDTYNVITTLRDWSVLLQSSGFMQVDRGTVVNEKEIVSYDPVLHVLRMQLFNGEVSIPVSDKIHRLIKDQYPSNVKKKH